MNVSVPVMNAQEIGIEDPLEILTLISKLISSAKHEIRILLFPGISSLLKMREQNKRFVDMLMSTVHRGINFRILTFENIQQDIAELISRDQAKNKKPKLMLKERATTIFQGEYFLSDRRFESICS